VVNFKGFKIHSYKGQKYSLIFTIDVKQINIINDSISSGFYFQAFNVLAKTEEIKSDLTRGVAL
jgi:hypothetical protein